MLAGVKYTRRRETLDNILVQADPQAVMDREVLKVSGMTSSNCPVLAWVPRQAPFWLRNPLSARPLRAVISGKVMKVHGKDLLKWLCMFFCMLVQEGRRRDG